MANNAPNRLPASHAYHREGALHDGIAEGQSRRNQRLELTAEPAAIEDLLNHVHKSMPPEPNKIILP